MPTRDLALIYIRLSGRGESEVSPDIQRERGIAYATENGWRYKVFDEGKGLHSARSRKNLPQWHALEKQAQTDPTISAVICYDFTRAFRNQIAAMESLKRFQKAGVRFIAINDPDVSVSTASATMVTGIKASVAQYYADYVSERIKEHYAALRRKGVAYIGHRAPLGLKRVGHAPDHKLANANDGYLKTIRAILEIYVKRDLGAQTIAQQLSARGYQWRKMDGKPRPVLPSDIPRVLRSLKFYRGFLPDALLDAALREQHSRRSHYPTRNRVRRHPPLLLARVVVCAHCDQPLIVQSERRVGVNQTTLYTRYRHPDKACRDEQGKPIVVAWKANAEKIHARVWEFLKPLQFTPDQISAVAERAAEIHAEQVQTSLRNETSLADEIPDLALQRAKLNARLRGYEVMRADGDISTERFREEKKSIESALDALPVESPVIPNRPLTASDYADILTHLTAFIEHKAKTDPYAANLMMRRLFLSVRAWKTEAVECIPTPALANLLALANSKE